MAAKIKVEKIREGEFSVTVIEGFTESKHEVNLKRSDYARLTEGKIEPEVLVAKAFEFLLEREPKESILPAFNLLEIARYFPTFERDIQLKLRRE